MWHERELRAQDRGRAERSEAPVTPLDKNK
jgi:hypothetical protein